MRILVISNFYPPLIRGGYEVSCRQMVDALRTVGHDVVVITSRPEVDGVEDQPHIRRTLDLPPIYDARRMAELSSQERRATHLLSNYVNPANVEELIYALERFEPEVAYLWNTLGLGGLGILALLSHYGLPWVWHVGDMIPVQMTRFGAGGAQLSRELAKVFPGRYLFVSSRLLGEVRVEGVDVGEQVSVVRNGEDRSGIRPRTLYFAGGTLRLVYAAAFLAEEKGPGIAIEAVARARALTDADITLDIYGDDTEGVYGSQIETLGLGGTIHVLGLRPHQELLRAYRSYDVFVFPTWSREPFGHAALDAAAAGCVPLFTHDMGLAEWLIDGVDCLKAPRTAEAFAGRLVDIVEGRIALAGIARRAQAVARRDFTLDAKRATVESALAAAAAVRRPSNADGRAFLKLARFAEGLAETLLSEGGVV